MISLNFQNCLEIDVTPSATNPTWARVGAGFKNIASSINEVLYQASYLTDGGYGSSEITGGQLTFSLTGDRDTTDLAQNYIFSPAVRYSFGVARKTRFRLTNSVGEVLTGDCTIAKADITGGDSNTAETVACDIHINGKPVISNKSLASLTVVSLAGATNGNTVVYINPVKESNNSYKYRTAAKVLLPLAGEVATSDWNVWDGKTEIAAMTGNEIAVIEVITATNVVVKGGSATVTAAV